MTRGGLLAFARALLSRAAPSAQQAEPGSPMKAAADALRRKAELEQAHQDGYRDGFKAAQAMLDKAEQPAEEARGVMLFREAIAWGRVYGKALDDPAWSKVRDEKAAEYAAAGAQGLTWISVNDRLPPIGTGERVLIYTEGADFAGEQFFDIKADDLYPTPDGEQDARTEVAAAATHWMPLPYPGITHNQKDA